MKEEIRQIILTNKWDRFIGELADELKVSRTFVSQVLNGHQTSQRVFDAARTKMYQRFKDIISNLEATN